MQMSCHSTGEACSFQFQEEKMLSLKNASVYFEAQTRRIETQHIPLGAEFKICFKLDNVCNVLKLQVMDPTH